MSTAFERLYRRHSPDVYRFALAVVRNPHEAEDVTQTTFLNAFRALERGDRPEKPQSWLLAIAHNAIRSRRRWTVRRPKEVSLDDALLKLAVAPAERSEVTDVLAALGELPVNQREALAMRELEGRSYPEIAETLGVTVPAVESLIHRARKTLRAQRASLKILAVVQLPRSLRPWVEHGDPSGAGVVAKAVAVVAAATVVAGGIAVGSKVAGATERDKGAPVRLEPRRHVVVAPTRDGVVRASVVAPAARPAPAQPLAAPVRTQAPPAQPVRPVPPPADAVATAVGGPAAPRVSPAPAPAPPPPAVEQAATTTVATAVTTPAVTIDPPPLPALPALPPLPDLPPVSVPSVTVPQVTVPAVP